VASAAATDRETTREHGSYSITSEMAERERPASLLEESLTNPVLLESTVSFSKVEEFALDKRGISPGGYMIK
jgi:hypothetical protein